MLEDLTGGFNYGSGHRRAAAARRAAAIQPLGGHRMHWLRCRIDDRTRHGGAATTYSHPPEIYSITAAPIGALLPGDARRAQSRTSCSGSPTARPARCSRCATRRCSSRGAGETLEVQDPESGDWSTWELREDFVGSTEFDRHFVLDQVSGEVELGPGDPRDRRRLDPVRRGAAEGRGAALHALPPRRRPARQHHRRRAGGAAQHDPRRRHGHEPGAGASAASTPSRSSTRASARRWRSARATARSPPRTSSSSPARRRRASRAPSASRPRDGGAVPLHIVPHVYPADRQLPYTELVPDDELLQEVAEYLDERRLIGTTRAAAAVHASAGSRWSSTCRPRRSPTPARVEEDVAHALYTYLNPLVGGSPSASGEGWAFGRALNQGELYGVVHAVDGVEFVKILRIYETNLETGEQSPKPAGTHIVLEPDELIASGAHIVKATPPGG